MALPWIAGLAVGKGLLDFFGAKSRAESARERIRALREQNRLNRERDLKSVIGDIGSTSADLMAGSRQSAMARAAAMGRPQDASLMIAPTEAKIGESASQAIRTGLRETNRAYDAQDERLNMAELNVEDPNALDFLGEGAGAVANFMASDYLMNESAASQAVPPPLPDVPNLYPTPQFDVPDVSAPRFSDMENFTTRKMRLRGIPRR